MYDIGGPGLPAALAVPFGLVENAFVRLTRLVGDLAQPELEYTGPAGNINSTATLIAHLARTDLEYVHCIKGEPVPAALLAEYGPPRLPDETLPAVAGRPAAELLERYQRVLTMAREYLATRSEADAVRAVTVRWWPEPATVRYVLWHMAGHSMFHQGQIRRLREWYKESRAAAGP